MDEDTKKYMEFLEKRIADLTEERDLANERRKAAMRITEEWRDKYNKLIKSDVYDKIEAWRNNDSNSNITLDKYLGMTEREYKVFVETGKS